MKAFRLLFISTILLHPLQADDYIRVDDAQVVLDMKQRLMWQDDDYSSHLDLSFDKAVAYCQKLTFAGYKGWRLPEIDELRPLIMRANYPKSIAKVFQHTASEYYWSATTYGKDFAWMIFFRDGTQEYYHKTDTNHVRCVRHIH